MNISGLFHPLVTPFTPDGDLDARGLAANAERYLKTPLTGLVVLATNVTLTDNGRESGDGRRES